LEEKAGVSEEKIVYAHGSLKSAKCIKCSNVHSMEFVRENAANGVVPKCSCGGYIKPDIVFFGERLTDKFVKYCQDDLRSCDLLIVLGTSLKVQPVSYLPDVVKKTCPRIIVNLDSVSGFNFTDGDNRDYFYQGKIDQFALELADALGWSDDLQSLVKPSISSNI